MTHRWLTSDGESYECGQCSARLGIYRGWPAIYDSTGTPVIVYPISRTHRHSWTRAIRDCIELRKEITR